MKPRTRPSATLHRSVVSKLNALSARIREDERQRRLNIVIGAASPLERWGLRSMLEAEKDFNIIGEAGNGHEALGMVREEEPDVVMFDVLMPHLHGIEIAQAHRGRQLVSRMVVLSNYTDRPIVEAAINAGVHGFVNKQEAETNCATQCARWAMAELTSVRRPTAPGGCWRTTATGRKSRADCPCLTEREVEVLQLIAEGHANKMIADILKISVKTVEKHRQSCMNRLNIHDTASLTRFAIQIGLIDCRQQKVMTAILAA